MEHAWEGRSSHAAATAILAAQRISVGCPEEVKKNWEEANRVTTRCRFPYALTITADQ